MVMVEPPETISPIASRTAARRGRRRADRRPNAGRSACPHRRTARRDSAGRPDRAWRGAASGPGSSHRSGAICCCGRPRSWRVRDRGRAAPDRTSRSGPTSRRWPRRRLPRDPRLHRALGGATSPSPQWGEGRGEGVSTGEETCRPPHPARRARRLSPQGRGGFGALVHLAGCTLTAPVPVRPKRSGRYMSSTSACGST